MEIKISNNTITVVGATRRELIEFATFINGESIPFNVAKPESVEISIPREEMTTPSLNEINNKAEQNDTYVNPSQLAKEMGVCHQCIDYHINKKVDGLPVAKREGKTRYIDREVAKEYFATHPIVKTNVPAKEEIVVPAKEEIVLNTDNLVCMAELSRQVGRTPSTLTWHIKHGMPVVVKDNRRLFDVDACKAYLEGHLSEQIHNLRISKSSRDMSFSEWQKMLFAKINLKNLDRGKTCSKIFLEMKRIYGIDLDSEKRSFYKDKGFFPKSTLETCFYVQYEQKHKPEEYYENIFENLLDKYLESISA